MPSKSSLQQQIKLDGSPGKTYGRRATLLLALFTVLLAGIAVVPLLVFFNEGKRVKEDYAGQSFTSEFRFALPAGRTISSEPLLSSDGRRVLLVLAGSDAATLRLWDQEAGWSDLWTGAPGSIAAVALSGDGRRVVFLAEKNLWLWEEGVAATLLLKEEFSGAWRVALDEKGARAYLFAADSRARVQGREETAFTVTVDPAAQLLLPFDDVRKEAGLHPLSVQPGVRAFAVKGGTLTVLQAEEEAMLLQKLSFSRRAADFPFLVSFAPGYPPFFRVWVLGGLSSPAEGTALLPGRTLVFRLGHIMGVPVPGDYNGDGILDLGTYNPGQLNDAADGENWRLYLLGRKEVESARILGERELRAAKKKGTIWGGADAKAVPADYDGDGAQDIAVFEPAGCFWRVLFAAGGFDSAKGNLNIGSETVQWGLAGDRPVPGDYNGDGCADYAVLREEGEALRWLLKFRPCRGAAAKEPLQFLLGEKSDDPVPADYDGNGRTDAAVFSRAGGRWLIRSRKEKIKEVVWQNPQGVPFAFDVDGDGAADPGFFIAGSPNQYYAALSAYNEKLGAVFRGAPPAAFRLSWGSPDELPAQIALRRHQLER